MNHWQNLVIEVFVSTLVSESVLEPKKLQKNLYTGKLEKSRRILQNICETLTVNSFSVP